MVKPWIHEIANRVMRASDWVTGKYPQDAFDVCHALGEINPDDRAVDTMQLLIDDVEHLREENEGLRQAYRASQTRVRELGGCG